MFQVNQTDFLTPHDAEYLAAVFMRDYLGIADAKVTVASNDGGIDVHSNRALAQVKHWSSQVGRPALQQLYGARGAATHKSLVFFSSGGYSQKAVEYANVNGMALFAFDDTSRVWPANLVAGGLMDQIKKAKAIAEAQARSGTFKGSVGSGTRQFAVLLTKNRGFWWGLGVPFFLLGVVMILTVPDLPDFDMAKRVALAMVYLVLAGFSGWRYIRVKRKSAKYDR